uniref:4'-phosphopantetheine phosphatase n=1 Tax=Pristiophorus japonicus TaxID=55135 RepID=UPI00398F43B8
MAVDCTKEAGGVRTSRSARDGLDKSITLPPDQIFRNLENAKSFAIDIGGSLTKLAYYSSVQHKVAKVRSFDHYGKGPDDEPLYEISVQEEITARLHFVKFENAYIETCLDFIKAHLVNTETKVIKATGGGAHKFKSLIEKKLGLNVDKEDEMTCLIKGCNFVLRNIPHEAFVYVKHADPEYRFQTTHPDIFPYLLVNIGSGVSIVRVESEDQFERIGGSSIGGGTFWGLGALLTKTKRFDELLQLASKGQHTNVDMLVRDIYGGAYESFGLTGDLIASSFGKSATTDKEFTQEDMAKSLLHMISNDIGQLACLYAKLHNLSRVYFGGFFIRGHPVTMHTITYSINYFTKGEVQALFLRHEGYLGAIGAFLKGAEEDNPNQYSWGENYAGSSGLMSGSPDVHPMQRTRSGTFDMLEMDRLERQLVNLPLLLDASSYVPDTVDLTEDAMAREYWLSCFEDALDGGPPHKCALFFVDNSGIDIILGVFPFVRELLSKGTEVILASNSGPALNDVTCSELAIVTERIAAMDSVIRTALQEGKLLLVQSGSSSPCLDLSRLDKGLATEVWERKTDLVIIEGMGRAIHTNYYAALRCESLKLAVIKNAWLADRLGGKIFSVVFKYEKAPK